MNIEHHINSFTLKELSIEAAQLWEQIEQLEDEEGDVEQILQQLFEVQGVQERKIDAVAKSAGESTLSRELCAYVADQLKLDVEVWEKRLQAIALMHTTIINRKQKQLESLKSYLLFLHQHGILKDRNPGVEREIAFQNNPPKVVLKVEPEDPKFPEEFREVRVEYRPLNKQILSAYKQGHDVSAIAEIEVGKHVRFKHSSVKK